MVLIVAFVVATPAAWTPASMIPGNLSQQFSAVAAVRSTTTSNFPTTTPAHAL
jgi:hypothetical protein